VEMNRPYIPTSADVEYDRYQVSGARVPGPGNPQWYYYNALV
jgi:hypothetical protein